MAISILYYNILEELNGIYRINQFCPPIKSKRNNATEIAIVWVMLSSRDRLNLGDGFREKGGSVLFAVLESELLCWKSCVNENTILGGWLVLKSIQFSSQDFSHFHVVCSSLSLSASFFGCVEKPLQMVPTTPRALPGSFCPLCPPLPPLSFIFLILFQISIAESHLSVSTSNAWSGTNVQRL